MITRCTWSDGYNTTANPNYYVKGNAILQNSAKAWIQANNVTYGNIEYNNIDQYQSGTVETEMYGVQLNGCVRNNLQCNTVINDNNNGLWTFGYHVNESGSSLITCNNATETDEGAFFGGATCTGTMFLGNSMEDNYIGLRLNGTAIISQQPVNQVPPWHGNSWLGTFGSTFGAVNWNAGSPQQLSLNLFTVRDPASGGAPEWLPNTPTGTGGWPDNIGWFDLLSYGSTFTGCATQVCNTAFTGGGDDTDFFERIAQDSALTAEYEDETRLMNKQYLYEKLSEDSQLLAADTLFQNFKESFDSASVGYLYLAKIALRQASVIDTATMDSMIAITSAIKLLADSINLLDILNASSPVPIYIQQRASLTSSIQQLRASFAVILAQLKAEDSLYFLDAENKNAMAVPQNLPDSNEVTVNEIQLAFLSSGISAIAARYSDALAIASQCPYQGGPSVYRARVFVSMINDSIFYDDLNVCLQAGYYRLIQQPSSNTKEQDGIKIVPNPANDEVEIILSSHSDGNCHLILTDVLGKALVTNSFECNAGRQKLNLSLLKPGIYLVTIQINDKKALHKKLVVAR